ncbi:MAG: ABC transporter permease, partial [Candidatus Rokuibacteriota bacterium]
MSVPISARTVDLAGAPSPARREWVMFARRLARRRTALFGLAVVTIVIVAALGAPWLAAYDPVEQDITNRLRPPGSLDASGRGHLFGTDHLGRDLLARMIFGARPALMVGFAAVAISGVLGMGVGLVSGYWGGRIDDVFMRLADIQLA